MVTSSGDLKHFLNKTKPSIWWKVVKRFTQPDCEIVVRILLSFHFWAIPAGAAPCSISRIWLAVAFEHEVRPEARWVFQGLM